MSWEAEDWAWDTPLVGTRKFVLIALARRADREGKNSWPTHEWLAWQVGRDVGTVRRVIADLVGSGYVTVRFRAGARVGVRARSNAYDLSMPPRPPDDERAVTRGREGDERATARGSGPDERAVTRGRGDLTSARFEPAPSSYPLLTPPTPPVAPCMAGCDDGWVIREDAVAPCPTCRPEARAFAATLDPSAPLPPEVRA